MALLGLLLMAQGSAQAQPAPPKFTVGEVQLAGARLISETQWREATQRLLAGQVGFDDLEAARSSIEEIYRKAGWRLARVQLPAQSIANGVVQMQAIEPEVSAVRLRGADVAALRRWWPLFPSLKVGQAPNLNDLDKQLTLANENPSLRAQVTFLPTSDPRRLIAEIQLEQNDPSGWSAFLDNSGNSQTGPLRYGLGWRHDNLWQRQHQLSVQVQSAPNDANNTEQFSPLPSHAVKILSASYRIPMPEQGAVVDASLGYSSVNSGLLQNTFEVRGIGTTASLKYTQLLNRVNGWEPRWSVGLDWRHIDSQVLFGGVNLAVPLELHPITVGFSARKPATPHNAQAASAYANLSTNLPFGDHGGEPSFTASRAGATARYTLVRLGAATSLAWNDWDFSAQLDGQLSRGLLVSAEQFAAGGATTVRGFAERGIGGDSGVRTQLEALAPGWSAEGLSVRPLIFLDAAQAVRKNPTVLEQGITSIASLGLGLRGQWGRASWRLDAARAIHQDTGAPAVWGGVHFSVLMNF